MNYQINFNESQNKWDDFVLSSPHGSIFCQSNFLNSLEKKYELITLYESEKIVAGVVIILDEKNEALGQNMPYTQFQGLILENMSHLAEYSRYSRQLKIINYLVGEVHKKYKHFYLSQNWTFDDVRPFQWYNYHNIDEGNFSLKLRYTALIDLQKIDKRHDYLKEIREARCYEIKKAIKTGFTVEPSRDINLLNDLHSLTFNRQNLEVSNEKQRLLLSIAVNALKNDYGGLLVCKTENNTFVSATFFLYDKNCGYYLFGANHPDYRNSGSSSLILFESIMDCKYRGLKYVDLVGVNSPNRGDYKLSFKAILKPYFEFAI